MIIGAGLTGAVAAKRFAEAGMSVVVSGKVTIQQNTKIIGGATPPSVVGPDLASVPCFALVATLPGNSCWVRSPA
ncbi:MAG TPA: FAD/NAD(P)-binding protein, partial [Opitutaceae bacterium]